MLISSPCTPPSSPLGDWHMAYILLYAPKVLEEYVEPAQP